MTTRGVVKLQKTTNYPNRQPPWPRVEDKGLLTGRIFNLKRNHSFVTKCKYWSRLCSRWMLVSERWRTVCYVSCPHLRTLNQLPTLTHSQTKACRKSHWQKNRKVFLNIFSLESIEKAFIPLKEHFACRNRPRVILILLILLLIFHWFLRRALTCIIAMTLCLMNCLTDKVWTASTLRPYSSHYRHHHLPYGCNL